MHSDQSVRIEPPLTFFTSPLPDELLYSIVVRHHYLSANLKAAQTRTDLFGTPFAHVISDFPCHLDYFCARSGMDIESLLRNHTILDFYRPFGDDERLQRVESMLRTHSSSNVVNVLGIQANQLHFPQLHRYCPNCAIGDIEQHGVRYLHVSHNLPGTYACVRHRCLLEGYPRTRKILPLIPSGQRLAPDHLVDPLLRIADWSVDLFRAHLDPIPESSRIHLCRKVLQSRNLLTAEGSIRLSKLIPALCQHWDPLFAMPPFSAFLHWMTRGIFPRSLLYHPRQQFHPIKHIVLLDFLFGSWAEFLRSLTTKNVSPQSIQKSAPIELQLRADSDILKSLVQNQGSMRKTARQHHIAVQTVKALAVQKGVDVRRHPQKITPSMYRDIWRKLHIGLFCSDIAKGLGISTSSVEQVLNCEKILVGIRKQLRTQRWKLQHRMKWLNNLNQNPRVGRTELKHALPDTYTWLYRHDRDWLTENQPACRPAHRPKGPHKKRSKTNKS